MSDEMDEIWALYADDGAQALDAMETALMALGDQPAEGAEAHVSALFRAVHTFKGNSRVLGLAVVESRAHHAEDLIGLVRDQGVPWDAEIKDFLLLAADTLRAMLEETAATRADVDPASSEGLMHRLLDKIARCNGAAQVPAAPPQTESQTGPQTASEATRPEPEPEPQPEPEPEPAAAEAAPDPTPEPTPEPTQTAPDASQPPAVAVVPIRPRRLADDPAYREIFKGMWHEARAKLAALYDGWNDEAPLIAHKQADNLWHAARQMGLDDWVQVLSAFLADKATHETLAQLFLHLDDFAERDFAPPPVAATQGADGDGNFFATIRDALTAVAAMGSDFAIGDRPDPARLGAVIDTLQQAARQSSFLRLSETAAGLSRAATPADYRGAELRLYEELAAIEGVMPEAARAANVSPRDLLQAWAAEHVFDTLATLEATLDRLRTGSADRDRDHAALEHLLRLVHHACAHYRIDTAGQLAMSLIDLFSRVQATGLAPDPVLTHIARGFIDTIELVFDALYQGETPDTKNLEKLFHEAANVCFVQDGLMTASAIERRLGLPKEFHRVLSPDSVRAASSAIEAGLRFYILRADINTDETLAEGLIQWLSGPQARPITNVTVFHGEETLFDFLIASPLDEAALPEALARIDPGQRRLRMTRALSILTDEAPPATPDEDTSPLVTQQGGVTPEMLEAIGEIAASQSMISHMLTELGDHDLMDGLDSIMRGNGHDWRRARAQVRDLIATFTARLQEVTQLEAQLVGQLTQLQEQTVEIRSRNLASILRPLETFVQAYARRSRHETRLSSSGEELMLDITLLESLRKLMRSLFVMRLDMGADAPGVIHAAFHRDEERVTAIIEDDGAAQPASPAMDEIAATLARAGGEIRSVALPGRGMRFHITLPLAMVVLDGMVVGVQGMRYVVPVDSIRMILQPEGDRQITVSAAEGQRMLRIAQDELVAIQSLNRDPSSTGGRGVFVVLGTQGRSVAVPVDELIGQQLVLLRPLRGVLSRVQNMTGIALLAGGDVGMVVSANMLCATAPGASPALRM